MSNWNRDANVGAGKTLTQTQAGICTLEQGWLHYLPDYDPPSLPRVCAWLRAASVSRLLGLIEQASIRRDQKEPKNWISRIIKLEGSAPARGAVEGI